MNINYKQPQFELFPANSATLEDVNKPKFLLANLTLSVESLVILSILGIMVGLFSFSIGVERGKQIAALALEERVSAAWNLQKQPSAAVVAVNKPQVKGNGGYVTPVVKAQAPVARPKPVALKAKSPVKTAKPVAKAVPVGGNITVQVATYKNESFAQKEAIDLKAKGYPTFLIKKGDFYLVCAGRFASLEQANIYLQKLQAKYRGSQIRRF